MQVICDIKISKWKELYEKSRKKCLVVHVFNS